MEETIYHIAGRVMAFLGVEFRFFYLFVYPLYTQADIPCMNATYRQIGKGIHHIISNSLAASFEKYIGMTLFHKKHPKILSLNI